MKNNSKIPKYLSWHRPNPIMTDCYFCGKELPQGKTYCVSCDHETITKDPFEKTIIYKRRSNTWYLLPIFTGIIGGIISFGLTKNDDPLKGKYCLIIGGLFTISTLVSFVILATMSSYSVLESLIVYVASTVFIVGIGVIVLWSFSKR